MTSSGELEQWADQLVAAQGIQFNLGRIHIRQTQEEVETLCLGCTQRRLEVHVQCLVIGILLILGRAVVSACATAGAVFRCNLNGVLLAGHFRDFAVNRFECFWCILQQLGVISLAANRGMRAYE